MDLELIENMCLLAKKHGLVELNCQMGEASVHLVWPGATPQAAVLSSPSGPVSDLKAPVAREEGPVFRSPMVGTFYLSSKPGAPPLVKAGDTIRRGQALGVIEAMKMFHTLEAEKDGILRAVLVENGQPVEFEQALFAFEPSS